MPLPLVERNCFSAFICLSKLIYQKPVMLTCFLTRKQEKLLPSPTLMSGGMQLSTFNQVMYLSTILRQCTVILLATFIRYLYKLLCRFVLLKQNISDKYMLMHYYKFRSDFIDPSYPAVYKVVISNPTFTSCSIKGMCTNLIQLKHIIHNYNPIV